jgi:hypothetical protein
MSEISDGYHLRSTELGDGIALLDRAKLRGFVAEPENGWVAVYPSGEPFEPNEALVEANTGYLIHYAHAEDRGWRFEAYRGPDLLNTYECLWGEECRIEDDLDFDDTSHLVAEILSYLSEDQRDALLYPETDEEAQASTAPEVFAELVGLRNVASRSYSSLSALSERGELAGERVRIVD